MSLTVTDISESNTTVKSNLVTVYSKGDFNRNWRVDIGDVTRVAYMAVGLITPPDMTADFNGDGNVTVSDAAKIAWYYVGKIQGLGPEIPVG